MATFTFIARIQSVMMILMLIAMPGCGGTSATEDSVQEVQVDPRFATAEALVAHYNSICTRDPVDAASALELFYAENNLQQRYITITKTMVPVAQLDYTMFQQFGECLDAKSKKHLLSPDGPAHITKREDARCSAEYTDSKGKKETLYLVRLNDRWWISGYTLEYDREFKEMISNLDAFEHAVQTLSSVAQTLTGKVRAGDFKSAMDVRKALGEKMVAAIPPD